MEKKLAPYDMTLKDMKKDEKEKWGETVLGQMRQSGVDPEKDKFVFLTGSEYMKPLTKYIPEGNIEKPMEGKKMGERLQWLNGQIKSIKEFVKKIKNLIYETISRKIK
jgi:hypothetical protein